MTRDEAPTGEAGTISRDVVSHVALLARLSMSAEELDAMAHDLSSILRHVAVLSEVTIDGDQAPRVGREARMAEDVPLPGLRVDQVEAIAPRFREEQFLIPSVLEDA